MKWLESFKANGYNLTEEQRKQFTRPVVIASIMAVAILMGFLLDHAGSVKDPMDPGFDRSIMSTVIGFRALVALPLVLGAVFLFSVVMKWLDKSDLGKRMFHWDESWGFHMKAATIVSTAFVAAALLNGLLGVASAILGGAK